MKTFSRIPKTVDEAVEQVLSGWSKEETISFQSLKPINLFELRNTLGADIRNVFSLWYGNDELLADCDRYLTENYEAYNQPFQLKIEEEDIFTSEEDDFWEDEEENLSEDEIEEESLEQIDPLKIEMFPVQLLTKEAKTPIDPYIASQVIIFAIWKHLQGK